jgi:hypothetical protein
MSRRPDDQTFRRTDISRAASAARALGLPIAAIEATRSPDGARTLKIIIGEPTKDTKGNELDKWMSDHARKTERA